jgi:uncharacterized protein (DUF302 family)
VPHPDSGIVSLLSNHSVDQTLQKLEEVLDAKGVKIFAVIDHSGEAEKAGLKMRPTKVVIFGNPKAGTPAMLASPSLAIDLPLKMMIWEDSAGRIQVSYNSPAYLQSRHQVPEELMPALRAVEALAAAVTG